MANAQYFFIYSALIQRERIPILEPKQRSILITDLRENESYTYEVVAVNDWGASDARTASYKIDPDLGDDS